MAQNPDDGFEVFDPAATAKMDEFKPTTQIPDELWVGRITPLGIGSSFRANRPEGENVRAFKKRINRAAYAPPNWKTLDWKTRDTNLPDGVEATHFSVKIKAVDVKSKAEYEAKAQAAQNGTEKTVETPPASETSQNTPTTPTPPERAARGR